MVDVDDSCQLLLADSQPKSVGLVWVLAATRGSLCIHQMNRVNTLATALSHNDSTINVVVVIIIIIITLTQMSFVSSKKK